MKTEEAVKRYGSKYRIAQLLGITRQAVGQWGEDVPELQALKGLTVPVRLSGPFSAVAYRVDFTDVATELVRKQLDSRKDEIKGRVEEQIKGQLKGLFGR